MEQIKKGKELTRKVVKFTSHNGNEFSKGDLAFCLNGNNGLFLGLSGDKFGMAYYESSSFEMVERHTPEIESLIEEANKKYFG